MERAEVLMKSKELVNQIFAKMNVIESCDTVVDMIKDLEVCFYNPGDQKNVNLSEVLNDQQLTDIRGDIISRIHSNALDAQLYLEKLDRKPATINPEFEAAVKEMELQGKAKPDPVEKKLAEVIQKEEDRIKQPPLSADEILRQDIDKVRELYEDDAVTVSVIAARYGVKKTDVYTFASKNRFARMKKPSGFLDSPKKERP